MLDDRRSEISQAQCLHNEGLTRKPLVNSVPGEGSRTQLGGEGGGASAGEGQGKAMGPGRQLPEREDRLSSL